MRVFLAGATGVIGRVLTPLLVGDGHEVSGMTRSPDRAHRLEELGARAVVCDALEASGLEQAVVQARPEIVIHELTEIPARMDARKAAAQLGPTNRLRREGTRNLIAAPLDRGSPGVYNVVDDDPARARHWIPLFASAMGAKPPLRVPTLAGAGGRGAVASMTQLRGASNAKAKRELGWSPARASWCEELRRAGDQLRRADAA